MKVTSVIEMPMAHKFKKNITIFNLTATLKVCKILQYKTI